MDWHKARVISKWLKFFTTQYGEFKGEKNYRCKIINIKTNPVSNEIILRVMISGIKNQTVEFKPIDLVARDDMLTEFSAYDVRAITFLALQQKTKPLKEEAKYFIFAQDLLEGKTIFIIRDTANHGTEEKLTADQLYYDDLLLSKFNYNDLKAIISTAIQEQAIDDLQCIED